MVHSQQSITHSLKRLLRWLHCGLCLSISMFKFEVDEFHFDMSMWELKWKCRSKTSGGQREEASTQMYIMFIRAELLPHEMWGLLFIYFIKFHKIIRTVSCRLYTWSQFKCLNHRWFFMSSGPFFIFPNRLVRSGTSSFFTRSFATGSTRSGHSYLPFKIFSYIPNGFSAKKGG